VRKTLLSLAAVAAVTAVAAPSVAQAKTIRSSPPVATTLPTLPRAFPVPTTGRVTNVASATRFSNAFAARNAARFLGQDRDRVRVTDVLSTCLRSPVSAGQFGCVFALNAAVVTRNSYNYDWGTLSRLSRLSNTDPGTDPIDPPIDPETGLPIDPDTGLPVDPTDPGFVPPTSQRRVAIQRFGCLGEIDIRGGATVTPLASVHFIRCARNYRNNINYPIATPLRAH
jgi:hypothetical protein